MLSISLQQVRFHAPHGLYPEEALQGNDFEVDVELQLQAGLEETWPMIDYARVYALVADVLLGDRVDLLETLVQAIGLRIRQEWAALSYIRVCVRKLHPPLGGEVAAAQVCFEERKD